MRVPSRDIALAGGLRCVSQDVSPGVWQEHVVKHPLGIHAIARSRGRVPWDQEGWSELSPPIVVASERDELARSLAALSAGGLRCEVPELRGRRTWSTVNHLACRECRPPLLTACERLLSAVSARYAAVTEHTLAELGEGAGVHLSRTAFFRRLLGLIRTPERTAGLTVMTIGLDERRGARPIARISRHDGVRVELDLEEPDRLRWRTTYRDTVKTRTPFGRYSFLSAALEPAPRMGPLSEMCVVARHWWESHGI